MLPSAARATFLGLFQLFQLWKSAHALFSPMTVRYDQTGAPSNSSVTRNSSLFFFSYCLFVILTLLFLLFLFARQQVKEEVVW